MLRVSFIIAVSTWFSISKYVMIRSIEDSDIWIGRRNMWSLSFSLWVLGKANCMIKWILWLWDTVNSNKIKGNSVIRKNKTFRNCHILAQMLLLINFVQCMHVYLFVHDCRGQGIIFVLHFFCLPQCGFCESNSGCKEGSTFI